MHTTRSQNFRGGNVWDKELGERNPKLPNPNNNSLVAKAFPETLVKTAQLLGAVATSSM